MKRLTLYSALMSGVSLMGMSCGNNPTEVPVSKPSGIHPAGIVKTPWGHTDGREVSLYTLTNSKGDQVQISDYGGTVISWKTPDKNGQRASIVVGMDSLQDYLQKPPYFGALVGRYGNRIGNASFELEGKKYQLAANNGKNALHGGLKGFDKVVWNAAFSSDTVPALTLTYTSKDGEEGYPGNLQVEVNYRLNDEGALDIEYQAQTDKPTPVNLTNHSYFNLTGQAGTPIENLVLQLDAAHYTPVDTSLIPTGEIKSVAGTPFDFTSPKRIGADIGQVPGGYDHNFVLNHPGDFTKPVATLVDSVSGRKLQVFTTEPGLQFYTGNFLDGRFKSQDGKPINFRTALCMETQHFPDSPNKPAFPSTILKPGGKFHSITRYQVSLIP